MPPADIQVSPLQWAAELHDVHQAFRRIALRCFYQKHSPGPTTTASKRTSNQVLAQVDYTAFLANGVRLKGLTQAMADGPFAITPSDTAWFAQILLPPAAGAPQLGFWSSPL